MAPKGTAGSADGAVRRTAMSACRGALQTVHSATNLVNSYDKEAARMLRTAEGLARSAVARLEHLARYEKTHQKDNTEKDKKDTDASMEPAAVVFGPAPAPAPGPRKRRRGRARKAAPPLAAADGPPRCAAAGDRPPGRDLPAPPARERSPRRGASLPAPSAAGPAQAWRGFSVGQTVVFCGLQAKPEMDGATATVVSFDETRERVAVKTSETSQPLLVKPSNIKLTPFGRGGRQIPSSAS